MNPDRKIEFPFGVVAADSLLKDNRKRLLVSDLKSHSLMEIDEDGLELNVIAGCMITQDLTMDQHKVDFSTVLSELQSEDHLFISLSIPLIVKDAYYCFKLVQKSFSGYGTWLARHLGWLVEKRDGQTQRNQMKRRIKLTDAKDLLELASTRLSQLIGKISTLHIHEQNTRSSMTPC